MSVSMTEAMISLSDEKASAERRADLAKPSLQAVPAGKSYSKSRGIGVVRLTPARFTARFRKNSVAAITPAI